MTRLLVLPLHEGRPRADATSAAGDAGRISTLAAVRFDLARTVLGTDDGNRSLAA